MPLEILEHIFYFLDLPSQIKLKTTCRTFCIFDITNFWDLGGLLKSSEITNEILQKYPKIKYLNLYDNRKVNNINFLTRLLYLNIGGLCIISDQDIVDHRKLIYINCENNCHIKDLSNKTKIKYLDVSGYCGVSDENISHLNLIEINFDGNHKITNPKCLESNLCL